MESEERKKWEDMTTLERMYAYGAKRPAPTPEEFAEITRKGLEESEKKLEEIHRREAEEESLRQSEG